MRECQVEVAATVTEHYSLPFIWLIEGGVASPGIEGPVWEQWMFRIPDRWSAAEASSLSVATEILLVGQVLVTHEIALTRLTLQQYAYEGIT